MLGLFGNKRIRQLERELLTAQIQVETYKQIAHRATREHRKLLSEWNELVRKINDKGGVEFLREGTIIPPAGKRTLTDTDIKSLLLLVHPDKHGGKEAAVRMTQRLLAMR